MSKTDDIGASLARENEFYRKYHFPSTPEEVAEARALRAADRRDAEDAEPIPFNAWHDDPQRISKLLLWLAVKKEAPKGVQATADFIANAETWGTAYAELCEMERAFDQ